jgi:putative Holliday junction resolvase
VSRVLGVDFGQKRVGIAISDPLGLTARPLEVVPRPESIERVADLVSEHDVKTVVVGLPTTLRGGECDSLRIAREFGAAIGELTGAEVVFADERYTSKLAERSLIESGMKRRARRGTIDKVAAAIILQGYLDGNSAHPDDVEDTGP